MRVFVNVPVSLASQTAGGAAFLQANLRVRRYSKQDAPYAGTAV